MMVYVHDDAQMPPHETPAFRDTTLGALMRNFYSGSWAVPYLAPAPIHRTMARWPKNQKKPGGEFHGSNMYRPADSLEMDSATSSALPGYLSVSQSYGMEPVDNHSLLLTACNRLPPVASLIIGLCYYPDAVPEMISEKMPGPLPPGPAALKFDNKSKCPPLVLIPFDDTPRSPDGRPQPHMDLVNSLFAFAKKYLMKNKYMTIGQAVGIIVAHKKTEFQCRRRLKAERSAWNGDTNFGLEDRFDDQASEAWSYWVRILAGQTAMSQIVDCALDARCCVNRFTAASFRHLVWTTRATSCTFTFAGNWNWRGPSSGKDYIDTLISLGWVAYSDG